MRQDFDAAELVRHSNLSSERRDRSRWLPLACWELPIVMLSPDRPIIMTLLFADVDQIDVTGPF